MTKDLWCVSPKVKCCKTGHSLALMKIFYGSGFGLRGSADVSALQGRRIVVAQWSNRSCNRRVVDKPRSGCLHAGSAIALQMVRSILRGFDLGVISVSASRRLNRSLSIPPQKHCAWNIVDAATLSEGIMDILYRCISASIVYGHGNFMNFHISAKTY